MGVLTLGCATTWKAGPELYAPRDRVAAALGEELAEQPLRVDTPIAVAPPIAVRPCCAFGVDLNFAALPLYREGNVTEPARLGPHFYGAGVLEAERNGLVYTCRGGWIDTAHVRENADLTFFLISQLVQRLPGPTTISLPGEGGQRVVVVKAISREVIDRWGRERVAGVIASWVAYQFALWHELASWFGHEALPGYSERVSTFSPEDMYSNALGIRLGVAVAHEGGLLSRANYDALTEAWLGSMLGILVPADLKDARATMKQLDGRWWDSKRALPDVRLVTRRAMPTGLVLQPWRLEDAFAPAPAAPPPAPAACVERPPALQLTVPDRLGDFVISEAVEVIWRPGPWTGSGIPWPSPERKEIRTGDLPPLTDVVHDELEAILGKGFEKPR
jgi:hypothetical protein